MSTTETPKFVKMHEALDEPIGQIIAAIDNGGRAPADCEDGALNFSPALLAGLSAAKVLLAHAEYDALGNKRDGAWDSFRARLQFAVSAQTDAEDAGSPTRFGVWEGLHFASVEAGRIDGDDALLRRGEQASDA